jgi:dipeptidyl aminopeptidase/acylaminoacyl peptidase
MKNTDSQSTPAAAGAMPADAMKTPLIPRDILFGNPEKAMARISPDGKRLSYLAPVEGVLNVWVGPADQPDAAKPVTEDKYRGIRSYFWAYTSRHILYVQDTNGDEDFHVYAVDLDAGQIKDLTPLKGVRAEIQGVSEKIPDELLIGLNDRDPQYHDIYRVSIASGERKLVQQNPDFAGFVSDDDFRVRFASRMTDDGGAQYFETDGAGGWKEFMKVDMADSLTTAPSGFDKTGEILYLMDSRGRNTSSLTTLDLKTGKQAVLAANDKADIGGVLTHPTEKTVEAVSFEYLRTEWTVLDPAVQPDFDYLKTVADGEMSVTSRTLDDKLWTVAYIMDNGPVRFYLYDRPARKANFLFTNRKELEGQPLVKMRPVEVKARDGLTLVCYLSLPLESDSDADGVPDRPLPLVLDVHGGPWARDTWGFDPNAQLQANRGYAVMSVNYRGSTGLGKEFLNAGNKEWAAKMHDDLLDAVDWAIAQKIADPAKVAITGGSYGGYATLVGLTFTPEKFACGVDIVGPSNLNTLLKTFPAYWAPAIQMFKDRVGDFSTEAGRALLEERSPLNYVERIQRPLLIGQGAHDPRVKQAEADQIVAAMQKKNIPVSYVLFPDEGHGFARPENSLAFNAVSEAFLAAQLGGRYEPIGNAFEGSTITVPTGAAGVPGLVAALKDHKPLTGETTEAPAKAE